MLTAVHLTDETQIDQPDTPAPIFAARAFKTALFGTPAPPSNDDLGNKTKQERLSSADDDNTADMKSPSKPPGILLTPGTATARRKRVSFGYGVKEAPKSGLPGDIPGKFPSPWTTSSEAASRPRQKSRLTEALENSRKQKQKGGAAETKDGVSDDKDPQRTDDAWEEVDDGCDADPDITMDLNDPRSGSGRYWKSSFEKYHEEAKVEMEKLVKYKQLAKSYAKMKDAEALDLNQRLKEEQEKVTRMEKKVTELARQMLVKRKSSSAGALDQEMMDKLTKQTALTFQYQAQVKELEALLRDEGGVSEDGPEESGAPRRRATSPRTQKTLLETQRELRRARAQAKELGELRDEVGRLKSDLLFAEQRSSKLADENKKLAQDLAQSTSKVHDVERRLKKAETRATERDEELKTLRADYDKLKASAKARFVEAEEVLQKKNGKISDLKNEIRSLKKEESRGERPWTAQLRELEVQIKADREQRQLDREASAERLRETEMANDRLQRLFDDPIVSDTSRRSGKDSRDRETRRAAVSSADPALDDHLPLSVLSDRVNLADPKRDDPSSAHSHTHRSRHQRHRESAERDLPTAPTPSNPDIKITARVRPAKTVGDIPPSISVRPSSAESAALGIDLMQGNFARLGGVEVNNSAVWTMNTSKANLPADRRAAALARLERKRAERLRSQEHNKENIGPSIG